MTAPREDMPSKPMILLAIVPETPEDTAIIMAALNAIGSGFYKPYRTSDKPRAADVFGPFPLSEADAELMTALGYELDNIEPDNPKEIDMPEIMYRRMIRIGARRAVQDARQIRVG